jgi:hypothetical protein
MKTGNMKSPNILIGVNEAITVMEIGRKEKDLSYLAENFQFEFYGL